MSEIQHASDCAVHNAPAMEPGPCDCGAIEVTDAMVQAGLKVLIDARTKPDWPSGAEVVRRIILAALAARKIGHRSVGREEGEPTPPDVG